MFFKQKNTARKSTGGWRLVTTNKYSVAYLSISRPSNQLSEIFLFMGYYTLHRLPNACELYRIPRECSRNLNLLVWGLIYWIATRATLARNDKGDAVPSNSTPLSLRVQRSNPVNGGLFLIIRIATPYRRPAMTKEIQCQAIQHHCHCECSDAIQ